MRYYKLIYDYENDCSYINCDVGDIGGMDEYVTLKGIKIDAWMDVIFRYNSYEGKILSDYIANVYRWLIVSNKFKLLTKELLLNKVQYLPIKLVDTISKEENDSFYVANVTNVVDALDLKNSKYDIFKLDNEEIISVEKYTLKESSVRGNHIFRLKDDTIPVFVSEEVKRIIVENNLLGFAFMEVNVI